VLNHDAIGIDEQAIKQEQQKKYACAANGKLFDLLHLVLSRAQKILTNTLKDYGTGIKYVYTDARREYCDRIQ
jgi:hypothetical protein